MLLATSVSASKVSSASVLSNWHVSVLEPKKGHKPTHFIRQMTSQSSAACIPTGETLYIMWVPASQPSPTADSCYVTFDTAKIVQPTCSKSSWHCCTAAGAVQTLAYLLLCIVWLNMHACEICEDLARILQTLMGGHSIPLSGLFSIVTVVMLRRAMPSLMIGSRSLCTTIP